VPKVPNAISVNPSILFAELKLWSIYRVAIGYTIGARLLQITSTVRHISDLTSVANAGASRSAAAGPMSTCASAFCVPLCREVTVISDFFTLA
jgi:hypothetical protein